MLVDGFWRGALVTRWTVLLVDGFRCHLPDPERVTVETGEGICDSETVAWMANESEVVSLARLLHGLVHGESDGTERQFASYLERDSHRARPG